MASITQDVSRLQDFLSDGLQEAIRNVLTVLIICGILFTLNAGLAVFVLLPTPLIILVTIHFGKRLHTVYHALWRPLGENQRASGRCDSGCARRQSVRPGEPGSGSL